MLTYKQIISIKGYLHFTFHGERQQEADALCDMALRCEAAEAELREARAVIESIANSIGDTCAIAAIVNDYTNDQIANEYLGRKGEGK